jgi:hypothetical protein
MFACDSKTKRAANVLFAALLESQKELLLFGVYVGSKLNCYRYG